MEAFERQQRLDMQPTDIEKRNNFAETAQAALVDILPIGISEESQVNIISQFISMWAEKALSQGIINPKGLLSYASAENFVRLQVEHALQKRVEQIIDRETLSDSGILDGAKRLNESFAKRNIGIGTKALYTGSAVKG